MSPKMDEPTWTVDQVAEHLGIATATVRRMIARGELKAYRVGGRNRGPIRIMPADVRRAMRPIPAGAG